MTMKPEKMLARGIAIASDAHLNQLDMGGNPYILHPLRIMNNLKSYGFEVMAIGVMHDVLEDSSYTTDDLLNEGFSARVVNTLTLLTHMGDQSYEDYILGISKNLDAILVKLEDIKDNSDITRLKGLRAKDFDRIKKYHTAYTFLQGALKLHGH